MFRLIAAAALLATGCATQPPPAAATPSPTAETCDAGKAQRAVGRSYSPALAEEARVAAGAALVRKLEPGRAYTLEFHAGRLNLEVDTAGTVTAVRCG